MALVDFEPERQLVKYGKDKKTGKDLTFSVRGLSVDDVTILIRDYLGDLDKIIQMYDANSSSSAVASFAMAKFAATIVKEAPATVAQAIALACDEPDQAEKARRLPLSTQVLALQHIGRLTFEEAGGIKKFLSDMRLMVESLEKANSTGLLT